MFEITYNDSDTLQNFIDADKAYHETFTTSPLKEGLSSIISLSKTPHGMSPWTA